LREHAVPASALLFELTESVLLDRSPQVVHWLRVVRELSVRLVLDDFGTRYSSLAYREHLDLHALTVDRSFMADFLERDASRTIVTTILTMAEGLGLTVVTRCARSSASADGSSAQTRGRAPSSRPTSSAGAAPRASPCAAPSTAPSPASRWSTTPSCCTTTSTTCASAPSNRA
jgi:predicted signal transduction protein with EAL and GGDEF domain